MKLDHVHLPCRDRDAMTEWLGQVFGLAPDPQFAVWDADGGPRFLRNPDGPALALFEGDWDAEAAQDHTIAFRVDAAAFDAFHDRAIRLGLRDRFGALVAEKGTTDHMGLATSIYFVSPEGHRFEVTTYPDGNAA
ncbi:VOC family protein [Hasllibacter sp. MH4015]|uniref:VOC family protein n=1 Tax=Hasllibacter sp. MH4015 TaxID=2854029 RepID=UPI001CD6E9CF|nr:VOC family protein [Hasllibacter sp. MH4015]